MMEILLDTEDAPKNLKTLSPSGLFTSGGYPDLDILPSEAKGVDVSKLYVVVRDEGTGQDYRISVEDFQNNLIGIVPPTDTYRLAFNMAVEGAFNLPVEEFVDKLCRAWSSSFGELYYIGTTKSNVYVSGVCHDQELFMTMYKVWCYNSRKGVKFVDMEEDNDANK
jgi:hypothetical protein